MILGGKSLKASFFIGLLVCISAILIGFMLNDYNIAFKITGIVSVACLIIVGILNGAFISGDKYRFNLFSETKEDNNKKAKITYRLLLLAFYNIVVTIIIFVYLMK